MMPVSYASSSLNNLFGSPLTPLQRARRAAAAPAARAAHVARKHLCCEPCGSADDAACCVGAASAGPRAADAGVYVALRVHDTKLTLLRLRAPPAPVAASPPASAGPHTPPRRNTPRPLPPARARALRQRLLRLADARHRNRDADARCFYLNDIIVLDPALAIAHTDVVADAHALLARLAAL